MQDSFEEVMKIAGVTPLKSSAKVHPSSINPKPIRLLFREEDERQVLEESITQDPYGSMHELDADEEWREPSLSYLKFKKLKRGAFHRQDTLDLHGYTVEEAKVYLQKFINHSVNAQIQCVKIIHGRGNRSPKGIPKLKILTQLVLKQNKYVIGYCRARSNEGGAGAKYVLLRRRKN